MDFGGDIRAIRLLPLPRFLPAAKRRQATRERGSTRGAVRRKRARPVIVNLRFFPGCGEDDPYGLGLCGTAKLVNKTLHSLIATCETVVRNQVPMAFRPRPSPCSIGLRYGAQALADGWQSSLGGPWFPENGTARSVVTPLAGFAGARRPQAPGGRTTIPAAFK